jgi:hypothetical protein
VFYRWLDVMGLTLNETGPGRYLGPSSRIYLIAPKAELRLARPSITLLPQPTVNTFVIGLHIIHALEMRTSVHFKDPAKGRPAAQICKLDMQKTVRLLVVTRNTACLHRCQRLTSDQSLSASQTCFSAQVRMLATAS